MFTAGADVLGCYKSDRLWFLFKVGIRAFLVCLSAHQRVHAVNMKIIFAYVRVTMVKSSFGGTAYKNS